MLGLIDYKLANSDHNQTHHCSRWGMAAKRLQGKGILKGETTRQGGTNLGVSELGKCIYLLNSLVGV